MSQISTYISLFVPLFVPSFVPYWFPYLFTYMYLAGVSGKTEGAHFESCGRRAVSRYFLGLDDYSPADYAPSPPPVQARCVVESCC